MENLKKLADEAGQFIMPRLEVTKYENEEAYRTFVNMLVEKKYVGGFCIFGGTVESLPIILGELQTLAKKTGLPPLLMSCDCEWGLPMRLHKGGTEFPHFMALAYSGDQGGIKEVSQAIGNEMAALGLHWNFAPVADVNSNPKNPIINVRSFSGDSHVVAECAKSFYEGLEAAGIISSAKHFPGHGDTHIDSHLALPIIDKTADEFNSVELFPFKFLASIGIPSVMTGHIAAPQLAESLGADDNQKQLPTTISPYLTKKLLRKQIGFDGVIITDSLEMHGLRTVIDDPSEIAVSAFIAGADILLMPTDTIAVYNGVKKAISENRIAEEQVRKSIIRINTLRTKYVQEKELKIVVQWDRHQQIAENAARKALHLTGTIAKPLTPSSVLILSAGSEREKKQIDILTRFFSSAFSQSKVSVVTSDPEIGAIEFGLMPLLLTLHRPRGFLTEESLTGSVTKNVAKIVAVLKQKHIHPTGVVCFGDPYIADEFSELQPGFILKTYSDSIPSIHMTLQLLEENILA